MGLPQNKMSIEKMQKITSHDDFRSDKKSIPAILCHGIARDDPPKKMGSKVRKYDLSIVIWNPETFFLVIKNKIILIIIIFCRVMTIFIS